MHQTNYQPQRNLIKNGLLPFEMNWNETKKKHTTHFCIAKKNPKQQSQQQPKQNAMPND